MIFRSELCASGKISKQVEGDNRHISITAGELWKAFSEEKKKPYQIAAELEKLEHRRRYPNYRFSPTARTTKPIKRKVQRNGAKDIERSRQVAKLLLAGKEGDELEEAMMNLDQGAPAAEFIPSHLPPPAAPPSIPRSPKVCGWVPHNGLPETVDVPDFIPSQVTSPVASPVPNKVLVPLSRVRYVPNYSATLPVGWDHSYPDKPQNFVSSIPRRSDTPRPHAYENVVAQLMGTVAAD
ncbi:hypothetical protein B0H12DRAFT_1087788 [Mycena haematopus]|nr:hypothetical protein B0H12DRAFT_1087788 [Mycena haematopus]